MDYRILPLDLPVVLVRRFECFDHLEYPVDATTVRIPATDMSSGSIYYILQHSDLTYLDVSVHLLPSTDTGTTFRVKRYADIFVTAQDIATVNVHNDVVKYKAPLALFLTGYDTFDFQTHTPHPEGVEAVYRFFKPNEVSETLDQYYLYERSNNLVYHHGSAYCTGECDIDEIYPGVMNLNLEVTLPYRITLRE